VTQNRRKGAPEKAPGGLNKVLYVRADERLLNLLDRLVDQERRQHPGRSVSRADVTRELLYTAARATDSRGDS
jgi:hypothetical protein